MPAKLSQDGLLPYSPKERTLFSFLREGKEIDSKEIKEKYYRKREQPFHAQKIIVNGINTLKRKIEANREPFRIASSKRSGPIPMSYWLEPRKEKTK